MSQHKVKHMHEVADRLKELARQEFMQSVKRSNFWQRLKFCWGVLFG